MTAAHSPTPEELMAYLDGELAAAPSRDVLTHLATCESCQRVADNLRQASRDMRAWQVEEVPVSLRLPAATASAPARMRSRGWSVVHARTFAAAAAVVLIAGAFALNSVSRKPVGYAGLDTDTADSGVSQPAPAIPPLPAMPERLRGAAGQGLGAQAGAEQRKIDPSIVRTVTLRIVASDFDAVRPSIDRTLRDMGGFVGQLGATDSGDRARSIHGTLRVPAARLDEVVASLKKLGRVVNESQQAEDVTEQVVDLDVRISNARITEKRLSDLIQNRTGRVSDVLEAEREMARVRTELERLDAQRKNVAQRVAYATLVLEVLEERRASVNLGPVPVPSRLRHAIADGFEGALSSLLEVALFLLRAGPSLVLWATLIGLPAWWTVRRRRLMNP